MLLINIFSLVDLGALIMRKVFQQNHTTGPYFVVGVISSLMIGSDYFIIFKDSAGWS